MTTILINDVTLIDGTGKDPVPHQAVLVRGERIEAVGPAGSLPANGTETIDGAGLTLLPGLINMHAHLRGSGAPGTRTHSDEPPDTILLRGARHALISLASGVTTIRDVGCPGRLSQTIRDAINQGILIGPRIVSCGRMITATAGSGWRNGFHADSAEELKKAVRQSVEEGVDAIKIATSGGGSTPGSNVNVPQYTVEQLRVVMAEARRLGKKVASHAISTAAIRNSVDVGMDTIDHCGWMGADGRLEVDDEAIHLMLENGTIVVPTMTVWYRSSYDDFENMSEDRKRMRAVREERTAVWAEMYRAGVRFATGPDTGMDDTYWDNLAWELELMVERMGMTPVDAIVAATYNSALGLGLEREIGSIESGKVADLLLVEGDPTADLGALRRVNRVFRAGKEVVRQGRLTAEWGGPRLTLPRATISRP